MSTTKQIFCPSCGYRNPVPLLKSRCVSCGAKIEEMKRTSIGQAELAKRYQQESFSGLWLVISIAIFGVLTALFLVVLPLVISAFDFEGRAGMMVVIPVWFACGALVGLVSPGRTFSEPALAALLVAIPTAFLLYEAQTVKVMPAFMYLLMSVLGVLFSLIGAYVGERVQLGHPPKRS